MSEYGNVFSSHDRIIARSVDSRHCRKDPTDIVCCCLSHIQAGAIAGSLTLIFSVLLIIHEAAVEDGLDAKNYVAIGMSISWVVSAVLLLLGLVKRADFLLIPWLILTGLLTPLFVMAVVVGCRFIAMCSTSPGTALCNDEAQFFGTTSSTSAITKLGLLVTIVFSNMILLMLVYKVFLFMTSANNHSVAPDLQLQVDPDQPTTNKSSSHTDSMRDSSSSSPTDHHKPYFPRRVRIPVKYWVASKSSDPESVQSLIE